MTRVAWLADSVNGNRGGAELSVAEFAAAAPVGVEVVEVGADQLDLAAGCDVGDRSSHDNDGVDSGVVIYALVDPRDASVRYVGKTTWTTAHRLRGHKAEAKLKPYTRKSIWLNDLKRAGLGPTVVELERVGRSEWEAAERRWIATYATTVTNVTAGGEVGGAGATTAKGEACAGSKLTGADVVAICERYAAGGITQQTLAEEHGVTVGLVAQIVRGRIWKHVDRPVVVRAPGAPGVSRHKTSGFARGEVNGNAKLDTAKVRAIRAAYSAGARQVDLATKYGVHQTLISGIVRRISWSHV